MFEDSVPTETVLHFKAKWLMLFRAIIAVYIINNIKAVNTLCG
jgi:hypothetical protein